MASNPGTSPKALLQLAKDQDSRVRNAVANNPNTTVEIYELLIVDTNPAVHKIVAQNPNTPASILNILAGDGYENVRESVAQHFKTSPDTLLQLANDADERVRLRVAENPNSPDSIKGIDSFIYSSNRDILLEVTKSPAFTTQTALALSTSIYPEVRERIVSYLVKQK